MTSERFIEIMCGELAPCSERGRRVALAVCNAFLSQIGEASLPVHDRYQERAIKGGIVFG